VRSWKAARSISARRKIFGGRQTEHWSPAPKAYRSYINTSNQSVFVAGLFTFQTPTATTLTGTFDMGSDLVLDLKGTITPANGDSPLTVDIRDSAGRIPAPTAGNTTSWFANKVVCAKRGDVLMVQQSPSNWPPASAMRRWRNKKDQSTGPHPLPQHRS
jgi:hypothetical protein